LADEDDEDDDGLVVEPFEKFIEKGLNFVGLVDVTGSLPPALPFPAA
jgi:hypothetical protein